MRTMSLILFETLRCVRLQCPRILNHIRCIAPIATPTHPNEYWLIHIPFVSALVRMQRFTITVDSHLSEHLGTKGWSDMWNVQITETGVIALWYISILLNIMLHFGYLKQWEQEKNNAFTFDDGGGHFLLTKHACAPIIVYHQGQKTNAQMAIPGKFGVRIIRATR